MPAAGRVIQRTRAPFTDEVARALADEANLQALARDHDPLDRGLRDAWETIIVTGRRCGEVLELRLDCLGRYGGLPMLWHDQTKVGNYDAAIRIPERIYQMLEARQRKTLDLFQERNNRPPTPGERAAMALFPTNFRNRDCRHALSYKWFHKGFKNWIDSLDIGRQVPHQARHSLATSLLRAGASLTHIRRYLGHVSERMAERYVHLAQSDLEDVLQQVWVAGPGTASPGELLAGEAAPLSREQAQALAIDLSRRSTPAEGGFCTFQPVVDGGACPWNLDCHNCDKFVLSGADLLYWRRKREQWRLLAEGAPDDATADYLHAYFEPTARAIDGLEKALAGLGLLDDALALDMRKPQDYFHRVWSTAFRAADLAAAGDDEQDGEDTTEDMRVSTEAALAARRRSTEAALGRVRDAITRLRREKTQVSVAAVSRRADVSRTFLYGNPDARAAVAAAIAAGRRAAHPDPRRAGRRARGHLARAGAERRGRAQGRPRRDPRPAHPHRRAPRPGQGPAVRMDRGSHPADHHREHHAQAARPHAHRRQPHPGGETQGRPGEPPVPRQAHRRPRSPARPAGIGPAAQTTQITRKPAATASRAFSCRHAGFDWRPPGDDRRRLARHPPLVGANGLQPAGCGTSRDTPAPARTARDAAETGGHSRSLLAEEINTPNHQEIMQLTSLTCKL